MTVQKLVSASNKISTAPDNWKGGSPAEIFSTLIVAENINYLTGTNMH